MELFDVVLKNLPDVRRHARYLIDKVPQEKRVDDWLMDVGMELFEWIWDEYLHESCIIYQLFRRVGVKQKLDMASWLVIWTIWDDRLDRYEQRQLSRAGIFPVRE